MIGPQITINKSCHGCDCCESDSYAIQGDSGFKVYCVHKSLAERTRIGDTNWTTPDWCPAEYATKVA